MNEGLKYCRNN